MGGAAKERSESRGGDESRRLKVLLYAGPVGGSAEGGLPCDVAPYDLPCVVSRCLLHRPTEQRDRVQEVCVDRVAWLVSRVSPGRTLATIALASRQGP